MNILDVESSIGLDRLATWNEVCYAMSWSSQGGGEPAGADVNLNDLDSDLGGCSSNLPEDMMWLAIAKALPDSRSN